MLLPYPYKPTPVETDKWCEDTLSPSEGLWQATGIGWHIALDPVVFAKGQHSITVWSDASTLSPMLSAEFRFTTPQNLMWARSCTMHLELLGRTSTTGTGRVLFADMNYRVARLELSYVPGIWLMQDVDLAGFTVEEGFDWSRIALFTVILDCNALTPQFNLDNLYFLFDVPDYTVYVYSQPTNKAYAYSFGNVYAWLTEYPPFLPGTQHTASFITVPEGFTVTLEMDPNLFNYWVDDPYNLDPVRTLQPSSNLSVTALYSSAILPLLILDSFDQDLTKRFVENAINVVAPNGALDQINVPWGQRVSKGVWQFSAIETNERQFAFWKLPDNSVTTEKTILWDHQIDPERFEVHWIMETAPFPWMTVLGIGLVAGASVYVLARRKLF